MPTHVYANNNEVASKASDGKSTAAFPDVCFSPPAPPVGPLPLPYPNTAEVKDTDKGTAKVFIKDKMSGMADDSYMSKSMGDEAATQNFNKGLITGALQGKGYFGLWSMDVQMEGKGVPRHLDMVTHNHGSKPTNSPVNPAQLQAEFVNTQFSMPKLDLRVVYFFKVTFENSEDKKNLLFKKYGLRIVSSKNTYSTFQYEEVFNFKDEFKTVLFYISESFNIFFTIESHVVSVISDNTNHSMYFYDYKKYISQYLLEKKEDETTYIDIKKNTSTSSTKSTDECRKQNKLQLEKLLKNEVTIDMLSNEDITIIACTAFGEASQNTEELVAIACTLSNIMTVFGKTIKTFFKDWPGYSVTYNEKTKEYMNLFSLITQKNLSAINKNTFAKIAILGAKYAIERRGVDFSNGAHYWDGVDFYTNPDHPKTKKGVYVVDPKHHTSTNLKNYREIIAKIVIDLMRTETGSQNTPSKVKSMTIEYNKAIYESTIGIGKTIFWKHSKYYMLTDSWGKKFMKDITWRT